MIGRIIKKNGFFLLCVLPLFGFAQEHNIFTIRQVDSAYAIKNIVSQDYDKVFVGNVFLEEKAKEIKFFCDSAYEHSDTQLLEAFGNVQVNRGDTIDLRGDYMSLDLNTSLLKVRNNGVLEHARATLLTDSLDYDLNTEIGAYNYGGKLVDSTSTLSSRIGKYFAHTGDALFEQDVLITGNTYTITTDSIRYNVNSNEAFVIAPTNFKNEDYQMYSQEGEYNTDTGISNFKKGTRLINKSYVLTGDNLNFNEKTGVGILTENCKLVDTLNNMVLKSNYMRSEQRDSTVLALDSIELQYITGQDTLFAHSDTVFVRKDSLHNTIMEVYRKVKFFKTDLQGKCDSMAFTSADSLMYMFYDPTIWSSANQLTADTITAEFVDGKLKYINLLKNAFSVSSVDTTLNYYNQMSGRKMQGFVEKDTLRTIEVSGNAEALYFFMEKEEAVIYGTMLSSDITVRLKKQKLDEIAFKTKPKGRAYPIQDADEKTLYLNNFRWDNANRPKKREDIFRWSAPKPIDGAMQRKAIITEDDEEELEKEEQETEEKILKTKIEEKEKSTEKTRRQRRKERREARRNNKNT